VRVWGDQLGWRGMLGIVRKRRATLLLRLGLYNKVNNIIVIFKKFI